MEKVDLDALKARTPISSVFHRFGFVVRGHPVGMTLCPFHGDRNPSCQVDDNYGNFRCFACGENGDHFDVIMRCLSCKLPRAIEELGGAVVLTEKEKKEIAERARKYAEEQRRKDLRELREVEAIWRGAQAMGSNTLADQYLAKRQILISPDWMMNLRFTHLNYRGFRNSEADEKEVLIEGCPVMVGAIRATDGALIGIHRTFLNGDATKLTPPGDRARNSAKQVFGNMKGGLIWLSSITPKVIIGEGIETTRSFRDLAIINPDGWSFASGISLGNIAGSYTNSIPHPKDPSRKIPGPEPDMSKPGIVLPSYVDVVGLLQDSDSDSALTKSSLLCAVRRFQKSGKRIENVWAADPGLDFNNMLQSRMMQNAS